MSSENQRSWLSLHKVLRDIWSNQQMCKEDARMEIDFSNIVVEFQYRHCHGQSSSSSIFIFMTAPLRMQNFLKLVTPGYCKVQRLVDYDKPTHWKVLKDTRQDPSCVFPAISYCPRSGFATVGYPSLLTLTTSYSVPAHWQKKKKQHKTTLSHTVFTYMTLRLEQLQNTRITADRITHYTFIMNLHFRRMWKES